MDLVERIKWLRENLNLRQADIAKVLGRSQQGYAHLENRKAKFTTEDIIKLCEYYHISADYLLGLPEGLPYPKRK